MVISQFSTALEAGGVTLYLLICCSILMLAVILEKIVFFISNNINIDLFLSKIAKSLTNKENDKVIDICKNEKKVLANMALVILKRIGFSKEELEDAGDTALEQGMLKYEFHISILGTLAVISPFIGLMGTVFGIIQAFADIAASSSAGQAIVAKGVSEALIATAAGLIVAIPSSIFFNYFKNKAKALRIKYAIFLSKLIETVVRISNGKEIAPDIIQEDLEKEQETKEKEA